LRRLHGKGGCNVRKGDKLHRRFRREAGGIDHKFRYHFVAGGTVLLGTRCKIAEEVGTIAHTIKLPPPH
jgi:hypothetical protein